MSLVRSDIRRIAVKEGFFMVSRLNDLICLILFNLCVRKTIAHFFFKILYFIIKCCRAFVVLRISKATYTTAKSLVAGDVKSSCSYDGTVCKKPGSFINEKCFFIGFPAVKGSFDFFVQCFVVFFQNFIEINDIHIGVVDNFRRRRLFSPKQCTTSKIRFYIYFMGRSQSKKLFY